MHLFFFKTGLKSDGVIVGIKCETTVFVNKAMWKARKCRMTLCFDGCKKWGYICTLMNEI